MINASAVGYYGIQTQNNFDSVTELDGPQEGFGSKLCQQWEAAACTVTELNVPLAILRLGIVLGHQGALPALLMPIRLGCGGRLGSGTQAQPWVHIDDVLGTIAWLCRKTVEQRMATSTVYNVVAPEIPTQASFTRTAAAVVHRPAWSWMPSWLIRLALGEQSILLLEGARVAPARLQREGYVFRFPALRGALENLLG
jgi:uncharacterized protein (TIGR01777 family)